MLKYITYVLYSDISWSPEIIIFIQIKSDWLVTE